jgi:hypothetical protein
MTIYCPWRGPINDLIPCNSLTHKCCRQRWLGSFISLRGAGTSPSLAGSMNLGGPINFAVWPGVGGWTA